MDPDDRPRPPSSVAELYAPLTHLTPDRWDHWVLEVPALIDVPSPADLHRWHQHAQPDRADALLAGLARLAPTDPLALAALAWLLTPVLTIAEAHAPDTPAHFIERARKALQAIPTHGVPHIPAYVLTQLKPPAVATPCPTAVPVPHGRAADLAWEQPPLF